MHYSNRVLGEAVNQPSLPKMHGARGLFSAAQPFRMNRRKTIKPDGKDGGEQVEL